MYDKIIEHYTYRSVHCIHIFNNFAQKLEYNKHLMFIYHFSLYPLCFLKNYIILHVSRESFYSPVIKLFMNNFTHANSKMYVKRAHFRVQNYSIN